MDNFSERIDKMGAAIGPYAKARREKVYIENFMRCKKALLMSKSDAATVSGKEQYAYAHEEYIALVVALGEAEEIEQKTRWALEKFKIEFDYWRTIQANERWQKDRA